MQKNGGNYGNGNGNSRTTTASNSLQVFLDLRVMQVMGKRKHWITTFGSIRALTVEPLAIRITCTNPLLVVPNQELSPTPYLSTSLPINHHCPSPLLPPSPVPLPAPATPSPTILNTSKAQDLDSHHIENLELSCWLNGESMDNIFAVRIEKSKRVWCLQAKVKEEMGIALQHVKVSSLIIWKIEVSFCHSSTFNKVEHLLSRTQSVWRNSTKTM